MAKRWLVWSADAGDTRDEAIVVDADNAEAAALDLARHDYDHVVDDWADGSVGKYLVLPFAAGDDDEPEAFGCTPHVQPVTWTVRPA
jgi:hypothetical protein